LGLDPIEENKAYGRATTMRNQPLKSNPKVQTNIIPEATKDDEINDLPFMQMHHKSTFL